MTKSPAPESRRFAIVAQAISKSYMVYDRPLDALLASLSRRGTRGRAVKVLDGVSFELLEGEVMGIVGPNGAGKSTLLKILAGTLSPSGGEAEIRGSVSAILELGSGFHPDYSGFDNIMLGGLALGMTREQVLRRRDEIIDFSELGAAIRQPLWTYSSGMQARLTFSTAIHVESDVLIVDEALAAGDAYFVHKCLGRMREICRSGASVLFVSHSEGLVADLCHRAMWLDGGKVRAIGPAATIAKMYTQSVWARVGDELAVDNAKANAEQQELAYSLGGEAIRIVEVLLEDADGQVVSQVKRGDEMNLIIRWRGDVPEGNVIPSFRIDSDTAQAVTGFEGYKHDEFIAGGAPLSGEGRIRMRIPKCELGSGRFFISVSLSKKMVPRDKEAILHYLERAYSFSVEQTGLWPSGFAYEPAITITYE